MSIGSKHVLKPIKSPRNQKQRKGHITVRKLRQITTEELLRPSDLRDGGIYGNTKVLDISIVCSTFLHWENATKAAHKVGYKGPSPSHRLIFRLIRVNIKNWFVVYKIFEKGISINPTMLREMLSPYEHYAHMRNRPAVHRVYLAWNIISGAKKIYGVVKARKVLGINKDIEDFWANEFKKQVEKNAEYIKLKKVLDKQQ